MRRGFLLLVTLTTVTFCSGQRGLLVDKGAFSSGIGGISVSLSGPDAILGNFSNLARDTSSSFIVSTARRFNLSELSSYVIGAHVPIQKIGNIGITVSSYGFDSFRDQAFSFHYARKLAKNMSLSGSLGYQKLTVEEYGSKGVLTFGLGLSGNISEYLRYGILISNPESASITETTPLISEIKFGLAYQLSSKVAAYTEVEKSLEEKMNFKVGLEYGIHPLLSLRTGFSSDPGNTSFGFSYQIIPKLSLDASFVYDSLLGITPIISLKWANSQNPN